MTVYHSPNHAISRLASSKLAWTALASSIMALGSLGLDGVSRADDTPPPAKAATPPAAS